MNGVIIRSITTLVLFFGFIGFSSIYAQTTISGIVTEAKTGDALIGCNVYLKGTTIGTATNKEGKYLLRNVTSGTVTLVASYLGFNDKEIQIETIGIEDMVLDIGLEYLGGIDIDEVVVTVQAKGQMAAINQQLASKEIKNIVSKERIRELPDANAAEAVSRLPGVSIQREGGEGQKVIIRGMSPKYNKITVAGVEMASTSSGDRSVNIGMISPYSLDGIEVTKAITPDKDADFIGGSVNFKLQKASEGFHADIVALGSYNQVHSAFNSYNFAGGVSNRFFDNKLGMFLQINAENRNRSSNNMDAGYDLNSPTLEKWDNPYATSITLSDVYRNIKRQGATFVVDYNISNGSIAFNNLFSSGNTDEIHYNESYSTGRSFSTATTQTENKLQTYTNVLEFEQEFSKIKIDAILSHSYSESNTPYNVSFNFTQNGVLRPDMPTFIYDPSEMPQYADNLDGTSRINYEESYLSRADDNIDINKERKYSASANIEYFFTLGEQVNGSIKTGGKYRKLNRSYDKTSSGGIMNYVSGQEMKDAILTSLGQTDGIGTMTRLPFTYFQDNNFTHEEFLDNDYALGRVTDVDVMRNTIEVMRNMPASSGDIYGFSPFNSKTYDYEGHEELYAAYLMANINFTKKIELIPGFRYEVNTTTYTGYRGTSGGLENAKYNPNDTTTSRTVPTLLPMVHLRLKPTEWLTVQLAYTNSLARPDFNILIPRQDLGLKLIQHNNFEIAPEKSQNWDLYLSFHQKKLGLFTIGGFTKKIDDKIYYTDERLNLNPEEYDLPLSTSNKKIITQENLKESVYIKGIELDWQSNFWYLPGLLKGLVMNINYTYIASEAKYPRTFVESTINPDWTITQQNIDTFYVDRMIDQPNDIVNASIGYDYKNFSIRVSMLYQSNIFSNVNYWEELRSYTDDYLRFDLSSSYKIAAVEGLQLFMNLTNLNSAKDIVIINGNKNPTSIQQYGMVADIGIRMRF